MQSCSLHPDYLAATFPESTLETLLAFFKRFDLRESQPRFGYLKAISVVDAPITIFWEGSTGSVMGVHLQISGSGLEFLRSMGADIIEFFKIVREWGGKITRLDVAWDCIGYGRSASWYRDADQEGKILSKCRLRKWMESGRRGEQQAGTFYLGNRQSKVFVRIYDKGLQTGEKDLVRIELELKKQRAEYAFGLVIDGETEKLNALLRGVVDVTSEKLHNTVTRTPRDESWVQMLGKSRVHFPIINIMTKSDQE